MLATAMLLTMLETPLRPEYVALSRTRVQCPASPLESIAPNARNCAALEVSGRIDAASVTLDPAFDVHVPATELTRPVSGPAALVGYGADGRELFSFPFIADGGFKIDIALASPLASALTRLVLSANGQAAQQSAAPSDIPSAEAIATDDANVVLAWNARSFPALRVAADLQGPPFAYATGNGTFEQIAIHTSARRLVVSFSDGIHSFDRTLSVVGR
jgi:hypothetical protein